MTEQLPEQTKSGATSRGKALTIVLVKLLIAAGLVGWLVHSGKLDFSRLLTVQFGWGLALLVGCQALMLMLPLARWFVLARAHQLRLSFAQSLRIGLIGYFVSLFLPTSLGLDGLRMVYLCRYNKGREHAAVSTVVVDRVLGTFGLVVVGVVFGAALAAQSGNEVLTRITLFLAAMLGGAVGGLALLWTRAASGALRRLYRWKLAANFLEALAEYRRQPKAVAAALGLSWVGHLSSFTAAYLAFQAMGMTAPLLTVLAMMPLVNLSGIIPLTPLGLGVADSVAVALFSLAGVEKGGAEVTMLLRAATVMLSVCGSVAYLLPGAYAKHSEDIAQTPQKSSATVAGKVDT